MLFFSEKCKNKREDQAEQNTSSDRQVKGKAPPAEENITRKFSKHRHFGKNSREDPHADQDHSKEDQRFGKIAHAVPSVEHAANVACSLRRSKNGINIARSEEPRQPIHREYPGK